MARKHHLPWTPSAADRAAARVLGPGVAFVPLDGGLGWVLGSGRCGSSAVLELVQAVYEACPGRAHRVLRQRIRTTDPVTPFDRAVVEVAAKRVSAVEAGPGPAEGLLDLGAWVAPAVARAGRAAFVPGPGWLDGERIVAGLVDPAGRVWWAAGNDAGANRTLHAEVNLVLGWGRAIPAGWRVVTSLQSCRMCAAVIVAAAEGPVRVEYVRADPGRLATRTALQAIGWEHRWTAEDR